MFDVDPDTGGHIHADKPPPSPFVQYLFRICGILLFAGDIFLSADYDPTGHNQLFLCVLATDAGGRACKLTFNANSLFSGDTYENFLSS